LEAELATAMVIELRARMEAANNALIEAEEELLILIASMV